MSKLHQSQYDIMVLIAKASNHGCLKDPHNLPNPHHHACIFSCDGLNKKKTKKQQQESNNTPRISHWIADHKSLT